MSHYPMRGIGTITGYETRRDRERRTRTAFCLAELDAPGTTPSPLWEPRAATAAAIDELSLQGGFGFPSHLGVAKTIAATVAQVRYRPYGGNQLLLLLKGVRTP